MTHFFQANNILKRFGNLISVNDVSFVVELHEIFGIAGPNGAGKTTLFNAISGIPYGPDRGEIFLENMALHELSAHAIVRSGLARTFQKETVFESLTVAENVRVGAMFGHHGRHARVPDERVGEALEFVGLKERASDKPGNLPLFDKKRLMLASALVLEPRLLLLDEPAAGLNQVEIAQTIELIRRINGQGITIILIEHVLPLLLALSQRIMVLNQGSKLVEGTPRTVISDERVIEAYLGRRSTRDR